MSRPHVRVRRERASPTSLRSMVLTGVVAVAMLVILVWTSGMLEGFGARGERKTASAEVLEARIATVGTRETGHGGLILYRIETHVRYSAGGDRRDRWIPASDATSDRMSLQMQLADGPKSCLVYWTPGYEDNARCDLQRASK